MAEEQQEQAAERTDGDGDGSATNDEFDPEEIEQDPAYNPDDEGLKGIKGG